MLFSEVRYNVTSTPIQRAEESLYFRSVVRGKCIPVGALFNGAGL